MAIKEKEVQQKSKLMEVLTTEYKWENLLLGILATLSMALSLMIITGKGPLTISESFPILGTYPNGLIFAWVLFAISLFGLLLVIYPFFIPAIPEIKKITWPTKKKFLDNSVRTLIFVVIITVIIALFDWIIVLVIQWLA